MASTFKEFTPEQIQELRENLWVKKVTAKMLYFTDEFKAEYLRQHKLGKTSRQIVEGLGFDPEMLGMTRVAGIGIVVKDYAARKEAEADFEVPNVNGSSTNAQLKRMQLRLDYAEQQIEFIKKTILLDREVGRKK
jgi:hypothetical protein